MAVPWSFEAQRWTRERILDAHEAGVKRDEFFWWVHWAKHPEWEKPYA